MSGEGTHLVIGASGLVGGALLHAAAGCDVDVVGTSFRHALPGLRVLDIRSHAHVARLLGEVRPSVVYLAAGIGNAEVCEVDPLRAAQVNVAGVRNVVESTAALGAHLVFFSSDYVFDGAAGPYAEGDAVAPLNRFGELKVAAERIVLEQGGLVVRTTVVYGWEAQGKNFVCRLLRELALGELLAVPIDQVGTPTYAPNLAAATLELAIRRERGVLHVAGPELVDRHRFACAAADVFGFDSSRVVPLQTHLLGQRAVRPLAAGLRVDLARALLDTRLVGYREGLALMSSAQLQAAA